MLEMVAWGDLLSHLMFYIVEGSLLEHEKERPSISGDQGLVGQWCVASELLLLVYLGFTSSSGICPSLPLRSLPAQVLPLLTLTLLVSIVSTYPAVS